MDSLALTGAELGFLLSLSDPKSRSRAYTRLRLADEYRADAAVWDGLSSLAARDLLRGSGTEVTLAPPVATVLTGLTEPTLWVEVSAVTREGADAAQLYLRERGAFLITPRAYGTFVVRGVREGVAPVELLVSLARGLLGDHRPAFVACRAEAAAGDGGSAAVAVAQDGTWTTSGDARDSHQASATIDEALRDFGALLARLSSAMARP